LKKKLKKNKVAPLKVYPLIFQEKSFREAITAGITSIIIFISALSILIF